MTDYALLKKQLLALAEDEGSYIPLLSNASALLYAGLDDLNWAGFYLMNKGSLLLGPFQGKVACIRIPLGKGVCGTAAQKDETLVVANVHDFPGHIACDGASNSEIVVPIHHDGKVSGVLDIDSPSLSRFSDEDEQFKLLAGDGMLVKRPLLVSDTAVIPGFKENEWSAALEMRLCFCRSERTMTASR